MQNQENVRNSPAKREFVDSVVNEVDATSLVCLPSFKSWLFASLIRVPVLLLTVFLFASTLTIAQEQNPHLRVAKVFPLHHRSAAELIAVIHPLLGPQDSIRGLDNQLVIRADETTLETVASLLRQLDIAPRNITVEIRRGNIQPSTLNPSITSRRHQTHANQVQQMRGQEGRPIYFVQTEDKSFIGEIGTESISTDYQHIRNGFQVMVTVHDGIASIDVLAEAGQVSRHGAGAIEKSQLQTRVVGPVGEWLTVTTSQTAVNQTNRRILSVGGSRRNDLNNVQVRVELLSE